MRSVDGQWLLRNFAYHDVLGSTTSTEGPLMKGAYWIDEDATETVVDAYFGVASGVLAILSEICNLGTEMPFLSCEDTLQEKEREEPEVKWNIDTDFWRIADELESKLRQWECPDCADPCSVDLAEAYRQSAFIVLYRKQRSFLNSHAHHSGGRSIPLIISKMKESINSTVHHIQNIPIQSLPECGLLFPLFMVGGETLEAKTIELVKVRIETLRNDRGFGNIGKAQEVLEELWRLRVSGARGPEGRELDWMDILGRKGWRLILS